MKKFLWLLNFLFNRKYRWTTVIVSVDKKDVDLYGSSRMKQLQMNKATFHLTCKGADWCTEHIGPINKKWDYDADTYRFRFKHPEDALVFKMVVVL